MQPECRIRARGLTLWIGNVVAHGGRKKAQGSNKNGEREKHEMVFVGKVDPQDLLEGKKDRDHADECDRYHQTGQRQWYTIAPVEQAQRDRERR
ncbi:hypothetical protein D9M68_743800 [compost metagenome]